eukprot:CAMPEP_0174764088 /NCGR_PEP_ID=MMETSP1094-20130205/110606_1 /TAXON_ID=156173 /ORGANISM="Chrysochromulina brevifilum, Strain UTEX LB 985" /LENGTH=126 /DNA_ID=CAMNT_0015970045 /DNA_START=406 /DNA_END=783 /DNA_ORIENTATION=-
MVTVRKLRSNAGEAWPSYSPPACESSRIIVPDRADNTPADMARASPAVMRACHDGVVAIGAGGSGGGSIAVVGHCAKSDGGCAMSSIPMKTHKPHASSAPVSVSPDPSRPRATIMVLRTPTPLKIV